MAEQPRDPQFPDAPPLPADVDPVSARPRQARPKSRAEAALPWALAAMVVLILAASGGLVAAWIVASMNAVPGPIAEATASPTPGASAGQTSSPTPGTSDQPRHTPTPSPQVTQEPAPFTYIVQPGDSVNLIAQMFQVQWEDIVALNDLKPPKYRIFIDQELLIPGYGVPPTPKPTHR